MSIFKEYNQSLNKLLKTKTDVLTPMNSMYILDEDMLEFEKPSRSIFI